MDGKFREINKHRHLQQSVNLTALTVKEVTFGNLSPNVIVVRNHASIPVYISTSRNVSATVFLKKVAPASSDHFTQLNGLRYMYFFSESDITDLLVEGIESDGLSVSDLDTPTGGYMHLDGSAEVEQAVHDDLNCNANVQQGNVDVGAANPLWVRTNDVTVIQEVHDYLNCNSNVQQGDLDVSSSNPLNVKNKSEFVFTKELEIVRPLNTVQYSIGDIINSVSASEQIPYIITGSTYVNCPVRITSIHIVSNNGTPLTDLECAILFFDDRTLPPQVTIDGTPFNPSFDSMAPSKLKGSVNSDEFVRNLAMGSDCALYSANSINVVSHLLSAGYLCFALIAMNTYTPISGEWFRIIMNYTIYPN